MRCQGTRSRQADQKAGGGSYPRLAVVVVGLWWWWWWWWWWWCGVGGVDWDYDDWLCGWAGQCQVFLKSPLHAHATSQTTPRPPSVIMR
jgi:hypothetical protein